MRSVTFMADNEITLLHCGSAYFPALIAALNAAREAIYFETYIFAGDATGALVLAALLRAAARGVTVWVITDWFGTGNAQGQRLHAQLTAGQVRHRIFNPWFRRGLTRSHRKICVVDQEVAFVGGININDDLFSDRDHRMQLAAPRWDFAVQVRGPLVDAIGQEAQAQWARVGKLGLLKRLSLYQEMRALNRTLLGSAVTAGFIVRDNLRNRSTIQRAYLQALGHAKKSVLLANPYFAPGRKFRRALALAASRGVEVTLLIGVGEFWLQDAVAHSFYPKLLDAGVRVVEYHKTQLHAKVAVVDEDWATVGSSNVDGLSLFLNQEANVVIKDAAFAHALRRHIEQALAEGVPIAREADAGWLRRLGYGLAFMCYKLLMRIVAIGKYA